MSTKEELLQTVSSPHYLHLLCWRMNCSMGSLWEMVVPLSCAIHHLCLLWCRRQWCGAVGLLPAGLEDFVGAGIDGDGRPGGQGGGWGLGWSFPCVSARRRL